jgi:PEGA domain
MKLLAPLLAVLLLAVTGCSTIINGKTQMVSVNSNVRDADITVNGMTVGRTPYAGQIIRGDKTIVTVSKDGYHSKTITLSTEFEPVFWGNIIFGGVLGSTTDNATGSMYKYAPNTLQIDLEKK